ncbi:MAG: hypothetical protein ABIM89_15395, partial [Mycobacteriales bacterium]
VLDTAFGLDVDWLHVLVLHCLAGMSYAYALLLFPDGALATRPSRLPRFLVKPGRAVGLVVANYLLLLAALQTGTDHRVFYVIFYGVVIPAAGLVAQRRRYRAAATADERAQSRVLLAALTLALATAFVASVPIALLEGRNLSVPARDSLVPASFAVFRAVFTLIPIVLVGGILRFRFWHVDALLTRTLVVSMLATMTGLGYVAAVVALPGLVGADGSIGVLGSAAAAVGLSLALQPARAWVTRVVNRLAYGRQPSPFELVRTLAQSSDEAGSADDVVGQLSELIRRAVGARAVHISFRGSDAPSRNGLHASAYAVPVNHEGTTVAMVEVELHAGDRLGRAERQLLDSVAAQSGIALHNVQLVRQLSERLSDVEHQSGQLHESRQRLAEATDAERERMQRSLEDSPQRRITVLTQHIGQLGAALPGDVARAESLLDDLDQQALALLEELRQLARGIYPPLLGTRGLQTALASMLRKMDINTALDIGPGLADVQLEAAAETAVYFVCIEAVQAAGTGTPIPVRLHVEEQFVLFTVGDCIRLPDLSRAERQEIADRLSAVGGTVDEDALSSGTPLSGRVPALRLDAALAPA